MGMPVSHTTQAVSIDWFTDGELLTLFKGRSEIVKMMNERMNA